MTELEISHVSKKCYRLIWDGRGMEAVELYLADYPELTADEKRNILLEAETWLVSYKLALQKKEQHLIRSLIGLAVLTTGIVLYFAIDTQTLATNLFKYGFLVGGAWLTWRGWSAWKGPLEETPYRPPDPEYIFRGFGQKKL